MKGSSKQLSTLLKGIKEPMAVLFCAVVTDAVDRAKDRLYTDIYGSEYRAYYGEEREFINNEELGLTLYLNILYRLLEMEDDGSMLARLLRKEVSTCPDELKSLPTMIL